MSKYNFIVNELTQVWMEMNVEVEADSYEEALTKCKREDFKVTDSETIYETMEPAPKVKGEANFEIADEHGNTIYSNKDE